MVLDAGYVNTEAKHSMHTRAYMNSWFHDVLNALQVPVTPQSFFTEESAKPLAMLTRKIILVHTGQI